MYLMMWVHSRSIVELGNTTGLWIKKVPKQVIKELVWGLGIVLGLPQVVCGDLGTNPAPVGWETDVPTTTPQFAPI